MQKIYFGEDSDIAYVILKVDNATVLRHARITQVIENPLRYFFEGHMSLSSDAMMRASWK
jgi:hypothetical protein